MLLWVFCLIDVITADDGGLRYLPKMVWLLLVVFIPLAGSLVWLVAGRPVGGGIWGGSGNSRGLRRQNASAFPEYETRPPAVTSRRARMQTRSSSVGGAHGRRNSDGSSGHVDAIPRAEYFRADPSGARRLQTPVQIGCRSSRQFDVFHDPPSGGCRCRLFFLRSTTAPALPRHAIELTGSTVQ